MLNYRNGDKVESKLFIAISRRFTSERAEAIYQAAIPTLKKFGQLVECRNAGDTQHSQEYWISRMGLIFDCCPIHLIFDIDRSKSTLYEFEYSNLSTYFDKKDFLVALFDCRPIYEHKPVRIIVQLKTERMASPTGFSNRLKKSIFRKRYDGTDIYLTVQRDSPEKLEKHLHKAMTKAVGAAAFQAQTLKALRNKTHALCTKHHAYRYHYYPSGNFIDDKDFHQVSRTLMKYMGMGQSIKKIRSDIIRFYGREPLRSESRYNYDFANWEHRSAAVISDLNKILDLLIDDLELLSKHPRSIKLHFRYLRDFIATRNLNPDLHLSDTPNIEELLAVRLSSRPIFEYISMNDEEYDKYVEAVIEKYSCLFADYEESVHKIESSRAKKYFLYLHSIKQVVKWYFYKKPLRDGLAVS